jgi:chemotaxis protein methyltransferase CheR
VDVKNGSRKNEKMWHILRPEAGGLPGEEGPKCIALPENDGVFFDDGEQFEYLRTTVLPVLTRRSHRLYVWSASCGRGGEPYSLALMFQEANPYHQHRITATDTDDDILKVTMCSGPFTEEDVKNIDRYLLMKYFTGRDDGYWLCDRIMKRVEFKALDLNSGTFERGYDLIIWRRNLDGAERLLPRFYHSLKEGGVLFTGDIDPALAAPLGYVALSPGFYLRLPRRVVLPEDGIEVGNGA